jgi:Flp pilus assembly CpaE family ATPase
VAEYANRGLKTVLVDADASHADVTVALGLKPEQLRRTCADLAPVAEELAPDHVEDALFRHRGGFACLLAPPAARPEIPSGLLPACVALLAGEYQTVLVHLPRSLDQRARRLAAIADDVVLVSTLDLFSLYGARRTLATLGLADGATRCRVVINRAGRGQFRAKDVERIIGIRPVATVRFDPAVKRAQGRGQLLSRRARRAGKDVRSLARILGSESRSLREPGKAGR